MSYGSFVLARERFGSINGLVWRCSLEKCTSWYLDERLSPDRKDSRAIASLISSYS